MQPVRRLARCYTTDLPPYTATRHWTASFFSPPSDIFIHLGLRTYPSLLFAFLHRRQLFSGVSDSSCTISVSSTFTAYHLPLQVRHLHFFYALSSVQLCKLLMASIPERPDAFRSSSVRHLCGDTGTTSVNFLVLTIRSLPLDAQVDFSYPATKPQHLLISTATSASTCPSASHALARPDLFLEMTWPSDVQDSCSTVVRNERWRSNIESHVRPMFQTAAGRLSDLAPRTGRNLDHCATRRRFFRRAAIPYPMDMYLLRRNLSIQ